MLFYLVVIWEGVSEFVAGCWNWWKEFTPYVVSAKNSSDVKESLFLMHDVSNKQRMFSSMRRLVPSHHQPSCPPHTQSSASDGSSRFKRGQSNG